MIRKLLCVVLLITSIVFSCGCIDDEIVEYEILNIDEISYSDDCIVSDFMILYISPGGYVCHIDTRDKHDNTFVDIKISDDGEYKLIEKYNKGFWGKKLVLYVLLEVFQ